MSRWIDADALIESICHTADLGGWIGDTLRNIKRLAVRYINSAPSIDIVRCRECVFLKVFNHKDLYAVCTKLDIQYEPFEDDTRTHYCAWGERQTERSE